MPDVFTSELTFGNWSIGIMTPTSPGVPYRTIQSGSGGLAALSLDNTAPVQNQAVTINIIGATPGSTITVQTGTLPTGLTLNSAARTITGTPTGTGLSSFTLRETLVSASNSPRDTALGITVAASVGTLVLPANWAAFLTAYAASTAGQVIDISVENNPSYTPSGVGELLTLDHAVGTTGVTLRGRGSAQIIRVFSNTANLQNELVGWELSADVCYTPNLNNGQYSINLNGAGKITFSGCTINQGDTNVFCVNATDIYFRNCNNVRPRDDHFKFANACARIRMDNCYGRDTLHQERIWGFDDGTAPVFGPTQPGSWALPGDFSVDGNHGDWVQTYTAAGSGTCSDFQDNNSNVDVVGQGYQLADSDADQIRFAIQGVTLRCALANAINADRVQQWTLIGCDFALRTDHDPTATVMQVGTVPGSGQSATLRGGQCTWNDGTTNVVVGGSSVNYRSGTLNGAATLPTDPTFLGTTSNVGGLVAARSRPTYTAVSSPSFVANGVPTIYGPANVSSPYPSGTWFTANPTWILGFVYSIYSSIETEWFVNAVSQGVVAAQTGMKFQCNTAGASVTCRQRVNSGAAWTGLSAAVAMASAGTTLNPADTNAAMVLSGGNLIAIRDTSSAGSHRMGRSIGKIPQTDGNYYFEVKPNVTGISLCDINWLLTQDPTNFGTGKACGTIGSTIFFSGGSWGIAPVGSTDLYNGSNWFGVYIRRTSAGAGVSIFIRGPSGWTTGGGDPIGAGGGHDLATPFSGRDIYASCWGINSGDGATYNFGATAYTYAASIGTVINPA